MSLHFYNLNDAPMFLYAIIHFKVTWCDNVRIQYQKKSCLRFDGEDVIITLTFPYVVTNANTS